MKAPVRPEPPKAPYIGILGGAGPEAATNVERQMLATMGRDIEVESQKFAIFHINDPRKPRMDSGSAARDTSSLPHYRDKAILIGRMMEQLGDGGIMVIPCNTAHIYYDDIVAALQGVAPNVRLLHMPQEVACFITQSFPGMERIGALSTQKTKESGLYSTAITQQGKQPVELGEDQKSQELQYKTALAIELVKGDTTGIRTRVGQVNDHLPEAVEPLSADEYAHMSLAQRMSKARDLILEGAQHLRDQGAQCVILGCTELPLPFVHQSPEQYAKDMQQYGLIDANAVIADRAVWKTQKMEEQRKAQYEQAEQEYMTYLLMSLISKRGLPPVSEASSTLEIIEHFVHEFEAAAQGPATPVRVESPHCWAESVAARPHTPKTPLRSASAFSPSPHKQRKSVSCGNLPLEATGGWVERGERDAVSLRDAPGIV